MLLKFFTGLFFLAGLSICNSDKIVFPGEEAKNHEAVLYYLDIDQQILEGILPASALSYPSFEIRGNNAQKEIVFHSNSEISYAKKYERKNGMWCGFDSYKGDTCMVFSYEYVLKDRIIQFSYSDTNRMKLMDVMEVRGKDRTIWYPEPGFSIPPDPANLYLISRNYTARYTEKYSQKDSLLIKSIKREDAKGRVAFQDQHTYRAISRSMFWWYYFGESQKVL
ncbi:hypothetical protein JMG10_11510 [Nostoc ellipsosporum NOK]|nr:hypothetical protein [Nostoc ellipsosporum NOK]